MNAQHPLAQYRGFLLDVDGVLVRGSQVIPGAIEAVRRLEERGPVVILTNNSTQSRQQTAGKLCELRFSIHAQQVVSSSYVAARYLAQHHGPQRIWVLGEDGIRIEAESAGHRLTSPEEAQWVIAGMCRNLTHAHLENALRAFQAGARLLATNNDATYPTSNGVVPGAGVVVGALTGMGYPPELVIGKPSALTFDAALDQLGAPRHSVLMIGDRIETDIAGGATAGLHTALVLSGVTAAENATCGIVHPTWIAASLERLTAGDILTA